MLDAADCWQGSVPLVIRSFKMRECETASVREQGFFPHHVSTGSLQSLACSHLASSPKNRKPQLTLLHFGFPCTSDRRVDKQEPLSAPDNILEHLTKNQRTDQKVGIDQRRRPGMLGLWRLGVWSSPRRARETGEDGSSLDVHPVDGAPSVLPEQALRHISIIRTVSMLFLSARPYKRGGGATSAWHLKVQVQWSIRTQKAITAPLTGLLSPEAAVGAAVPLSTRLQGQLPPQRRRTLPQEQPEEMWCSRSGIRQDVSC